MSGLLSRWGCEVALAGSGREALAAARTAEGVDLIIADLHLDDGESGVDVLDAARLGAAAQVPALVVTADASDATSAAVAARGYQLLRKPIKPAELRSLMAYLLA